MTHMEDRYARHRVIPEIGDAGQEKIAAATALIVGCGALGSIQAQLLVRAGVGSVRIADNDVAELVNLQRQILFDEDDVACGRPKAEIAAAKLGRVNSEVVVEGIVTRVGAENIESLIEDVDIVMDACDNFATRYVINDACVKNGLPWIYGGVIGATGMCLPVVPGQGPCMRCIFPLPPEPGSSPTGVEAGILSSAPAVVGALQCAHALRLLVEGGLTCHPLAMLDLWNGSLRTVDVIRDQQCPCCGRGLYEFL
ncbi:MAG TPA: HesA/MoeB/ThiF family protein [Myxococcota bacterium]|nr:HesA/MoeB/ThiF family protein [Myxococcota bacterium]